MTIGWPQVIYLFLLAIDIGGSFANHGKPKTGTHDAFVSLIASAIVLALLWWGGFFK